MRSNFYEMHKNVIIDNYVMLGKNKKTIFFLISAYYFYSNFLLLELLLHITS